MQSGFIFLWEVCNAYTLQKQSASLAKGRVSACDLLNFTGSFSWNYFYVIKITRLTRNAIKRCQNESTEAMQTNGSGQRFIDFL